MPEDVVFQTKPVSAVGLLGQAVAEKAPPGFVLADAGYGSDTAFREAVTALGLPYAMGIAPTTSVWAPGVRPLTQAKPWGGKGPRPLPRLRRDDEHKPVPAKQLALELPFARQRPLTRLARTKPTLLSPFPPIHLPPTHHATY